MFVAMVSSIWDIIPHSSQWRNCQQHLFDLRSKPSKGPFGTLAIALSPTPGRNPGSDIRFDSREPWVPKWTTGFTGQLISQAMHYNY